MAEANHPAGSGSVAAPNLVGRDFTAEALNHTWFGDGTEIDTDEGKLYLTAFSTRSGSCSVGALALTLRPTTAGGTR